MAERMTLLTFIDKYCQDIVAPIKKQDMDVPEDMFTYDYIEEDEEGRSTKYIQETGGEPIRVSDIIKMEEDEFVKAYPHPLSLGAYRSYLSSFRILHGEELLEIFRKQLLSEVSRIQVANNSLDNLVGLIL